ncbi:MAG: hypothetical protein MZV70_37410 [Desulfobacterales bacterium]|nr:hypothetical protein [Desulfobacterales bacterium]
MFGYEPRSMAGGRAVAYATREKALLDLLYLYILSMIRRTKWRTCVSTRATSHADVGLETLAAFTERFHSRALERRVRLLRRGVRTMISMDAIGASTLNP